jgi:hypothetical protein
MDTQQTNGQTMTDDMGKPLTAQPVSLPHLSVNGSMLDGFMYLLQQMKDGKLPEESQPFDSGSQTSLAQDKPTTENRHLITNDISALDKLEKALTDALSAVQELKANQQPFSTPEEISTDNPRPDELETTEPAVETETASQPEPSANISEIKDALTQAVSSLSIDTNDPKWLLAIVDVLKTKGVNVDTETIRSIFTNQT